ncbi:hypothetical protein Godav_012149 [Gossypium davidsonii]|uniref:Bifunctional inhibitor/plant lipid transfer protein/seed storage helical domain-containing protein n=1 Tax=Gossypium davidsonii TaxID=34287 RepID=A0A7J8RCF9_GOSDV|nr:hypothetical protein [Gossypium davidsonii]
MMSLLTFGLTCHEEAGCIQDWDIAQSKQNKTKPKINMKPDNAPRMKNIDRSSDFTIPLSSIIKGTKLLGFERDGFEKVSIAYPLSCTQHSLLFSSQCSWFLPTPSPSPCAKGKCPIDALKLGVCANILGLANVTIGTPPVQPCCSLLQGLTDLEAAVCLCTAIKANILGINLNVPVSLNLLLNICSRKVPS